MHLTGTRIMKQIEIFNILQWSVFFFLCFSSKFLYPSTFLVLLYVLLYVYLTPYENIILLGLRSGYCMQIPNDRVEGPQAGRRPIIIKKERLNERWRTRDSSELLLFVCSFVLGILAKSECTLYAVGKV